MVSTTQKERVVTVIMEKPEIEVSFPISIMLLFRFLYRTLKDSHPRIFIGRTRPRRTAAVIMKANSFQEMLQTN